MNIGILFLVTIIFAILTACSQNQNTIEESSQRSHSVIRSSHCDSGYHPTPNKSDKDAYFNWARSQRDCIQQEQRMSNQNFYYPEDVVP